MANRPWQPVLEGPSVDRAWNVIDHIATALRAPPAPYDGHIVDDLLRAGLFAREAGFAVFYSYLARARQDDRELRELASSYLGQAVDRIDAIATERPQFSYGFAGTAWALQHLGDYLDAGGDDGDPLISVDTALAEVVAAKAADAPFMLNTGFVGYGLYALERMPRPSARHCLEAVCDKLVTAAEPDGDGARWRIRGQWMVGETEPTDEHHTGIRSGAAGPIALLGAAARWGVAPERARATVARGTTWLWAQRRDDRLPPVAGGTGERAGYSHGAAATAAAMLAGNQDTDPATTACALAIGLAAANRDPDVADSSLEAGTAGTALAFMRLHHATGDPQFREAATRWLEALLAAYDPSIDLGGYRFHVPEWERRFLATIPTGHRELPGISFGVAGIALTLLAAITPNAPDWDRMFLLSVSDPSDPRGDR